MADDDKDPEKEGVKGDAKVEKGFDLDEVIDHAMKVDKKRGATPGREITRVSELVATDLEAIPEEELQSQRDLAIQEYIMDLEADLEERMRAIEEERKKRETLESEVEDLRKSLEEAREGKVVDEGVQGYLTDLEEDLRNRISALETERTERERLENELEGLRSQLNSTSKAQGEMMDIRTVLERTKVDGDVEIARLEEEQRRKGEDIRALKDKVETLQGEIGKRSDLIEDMRTRVTESEATIIDYKTKVNELEVQLENERLRCKEVGTRAEGLSSELGHFKERLASKDEQVQDAEITSRSLDDMKSRLVETSSRFDEEMTERKRIEAELSRLKEEMEKVNRDMEGDVSTLRSARDDVLGQLEEEKRRRLELEKEIGAVSSRINDADAQVRDELEGLKEERARLLEGTKEKEAQLEREMLKTNVEREELIRQKELLEQERNLLEEMRARTEKELAERDTLFSETDSRLKVESTLLVKEKEDLSEMATKLIERERYMADREGALKRKEDKLRSDLRAMALDLPSKPSGVPGKEVQLPDILGPEERPRKDVGEEDAMSIHEQVRRLSPGPRSTEEKGVGPAKEEERSEVPPHPAKPRIWPPLGSMTQRPAEEEPYYDIEARSPEHHPRTTAGTARPLPPEERPKRSLAWPDSAYEAEARVENRHHVHGKHTAGVRRPGFKKRNMLDRYVNVKSEPEKRPRGMVFRCMCGTEIEVTERHRRDGFICPRCGKKLM